MLTIARKPRARGVLAPLAAAWMLLALACGSGSSENSSQQTPSPGEGTATATAAAEFKEGALEIAIDMLDVGLLKGNVNAQASSGQRVTALKVAAVDPQEAQWKVLEFVEGLGSGEASEFFEVVLQELPRGQQLQITATATFEAGDGSKVEREVKDHWPP